MNNTFLYIFLSFLIASIFCTNIIFAEQPSSRWPWEGSDLKPDSRLHYARLENGFSYAFYPNDKPKDRVYMHLLVRAGSAHEGEGEEGLAHFLEHMAFNGSKNFKPGSLVPFFQELGMSFGGDTNAHTALERTVYDIVLPKGDEELLDKGLKVMADYAGGLLFLPEEIERERGIILAEKRDRDSAAYRMHRAEQEFLFKDTLIAKRPPIGLESVIKNVKQADFKRFYGKWYRPERMTLIVVGKVDQRLLEEKIALYFSSLSSGKEKPEEPDFGKVGHKDLEFFCHEEKGAAGFNLSLGSIENIEPEVHSFAMEKKTFLSYMAMRILDLRLKKALLEEDPPFISAVAYNHSFYRSLNISDIRVSCLYENWEQSLSFLVKSLKEALLYGFFDYELDRVKKELLAWLKEEIAAYESRESKELAADLLRAFYSEKVPFGLEFIEEKLLPFLEAVSLDDINKNFKELWEDKNTLLRFTGGEFPLDKEKLLFSLRDIFLREGELKESDLKSYSGYEKKDLTFPYLPAPEIGNSLKKVWEDEKLGIRDVLFEDGLVLHLKTTDFEKDKFRIRVRFGTGRAGEPVPGISYLASDIINLSGTSKLEKEDIELLFAGKRVSLNFGISTDYNYFNGEGRSDELEDLLHLLRARLEDPAFRKTAFQLAISRYKKKLKEAESDLNKSFARISPCFFSSQDFRFCQPEERDMDFFTLREIENWLRPSFASDNLEISIAGDFDPDKAVLLVSSILAGREKGLSTTLGVSDAAPVFPAGTTMKKKLKANPPASIVQWGFFAPLGSSSLQLRGLNLLSLLIKETLREDIRENLSLAYSPFSYYWTKAEWSEWGVILAGASFDKEKFELLDGAFLDICEKLGSEDLDEALLERVRGPFLNSLENRKQKNTYWLHEVMDGSLSFPDKRKWAKSLIEDYQSWNAKELRKLASDLLKKEGLSVLHIYSED